MKIIIILFSLLFSFTSQSCSNSQSKNNTPKELTGSVLWQISENGLSVPSYILGSYHVETHTVLSKIKKLNQNFDKSECIIGELDMSEMMSQIVGLQSKTMMPTDTAYQELLSVDDYRYLDEKLATIFGSGLASFGTMKPATITNLYVLHLYNEVSKKQLNNPTQGMDFYFQLKAKDTNKSIIGLETVEEQLNLLYNSKSLKVQAEELICLLKNEEDTKDDILKLNKAYAEGDLKTMYILANDDNSPCPLSKSFEEEVLNKRNDNWMTVLPDLMNKKSCFVVVGALHLCGEKGLLQQFVDLGYTVTPVY